MSNIDLGNNPTGTPPTSGEKSQIRSIIGLGTGDSGVFRGMYLAENDTYGVFIIPYSDDCIYFNAYNPNELSVGYLFGNNGRVHAGFSEGNGYIEGSTPRFDVRISGNTKVYLGAATPDVSEGGLYSTDDAKIASYDWNTQDYYFGGKTLRISSSPNAAATFTVPVTFSSGISGTQTNDSAAAGRIGQYTGAFVASGSASSLTTAVAKNVTGIPLSAGDWDVEANVNFNFSGASISGLVVGISTGSGTLPTDGSECYSFLQNTGVGVLESITLPRKRITVAAQASGWLVVRAIYSGGTGTVFGGITARRPR